MTRTLWSRKWHHGPKEFHADTGEWLWRPVRLEVNVQLEPRDVWVGVLWQSYPSEREFWVCLVPCLVVSVWWSRRAFYDPPKDLRTTEAPARPLYEVDRRSWT
jgi:hypothetical protein